MDDIILRTRYPRHSNIVRRRRRNTRDAGNLNKIILRQLLISILLLAVILLIRSINSPVTNYLTGMVRQMLTESIDMDGVYRSVENFLGIKGIEGPKDDTDESGLAIPANAPVSGSQNNKASDIEASLIKPLDGYITSYFGKRTNELTNAEELHYGIDIGAAKGDRIKAALGGTVSDTGSDKSYGNFVKIDHGKGLSTVYAHCSFISVMKGQKVKQGDVIASVGDTGKASGYHLHFELWKDGTALDPLNYMDYQ